MNFDPMLAVYGLLIGTVVGLTGMGGSSFMAPMLILLGVRPLVVVGTDLSYSVLTKLIGGVQHLRYGSVDLTIVRRLAIGSLPGALLGVTILSRLGGDEADHLITRVLGLALILVASTIVLRLLLPGLRLPTLPPAYLALAGFIIGVLVGITSVGSGSLITALLAFGTRMSSRAIVGTVLVHAFFLVTIAALGHWEAGSIDLGLTVNLLVGAVPGAAIGSRISVHLPEKTLRSTLGVVLFGIGFRMLV